MISNLPSTMSKVERISAESGNLPQIEEEIRVISQIGNVWELELFLPSPDIDEKELAKVLTELKSKFAEELDLPRKSLQFQDFVRSYIVENGVFIHIKIEKASPKKGLPKFYIEQDYSPEGIPYTDMICHADLMPYDEFDKPLTPDRVLKMMKKAGVAYEFIDKNFIKDLVERTVRQNKPVQVYPIARGIFPEAGIDAEIEFYFHVNPDEKFLDEYFSSKKVEKDDLLCSKKAGKSGKKQGKNLRGSIIPPGKEIDIELIAGKNVWINSAKTDVYADKDGLVFMSRKEVSVMTPGGMKIYPSKITFRVDPLMIYDAESGLSEITTNQSVQIVGQLKKGSKIISSGEVHINGAIKEDTYIHASQDLLVNGSVTNGNLQSSKNIITRDDVHKSKIIASENIFVQGTVTDSELAGKEIYADEIKGGSVYAASHVAVKRENKREDGMSAAIHVGTMEFLKKKIEENEIFINDAEANINKLKSYFGDVIIDQVQATNIQLMLVKFKKMKFEETGEEIPSANINELKKLLYGIVPIKKILDEKLKENAGLKEKIQKRELDKKMVVVKEKIVPKRQYDTKTVSVKKGKKVQDDPIADELGNLDGIYEP